MHVAPAHEPRVETFGEKDDLFAPGQDAQRAAKVFQETQLPLDARTVVLIVKLLLAAGNVGREIIDGAYIGACRGIVQGNLKNGAPGDAQRVGGNKCTRVGDGRTE